MQYDVFISYSRKDTEVANQICKAFDEVGITYFIDRQGISGGFEFPTVLAEAIVNCKIFLYLASQNSYDSRFTQSEITFAFNEKPKGSILPYIIDGSTMPPALRFVFSNINWRRFGEHPINTVLVDDLLHLLGKNRLIIPDDKIILPTPKCRKVDLGLSICWADRNVGASSPEDNGDYFAWGETEPKSEYTTKNYRFLYENIGKDISGTTYDAAHAKWGNNWRMPTLIEIQELMNKCNWEWKTLHGNDKGYLITGPNGNCIFLPAAGYQGDPNAWGVSGRYWSGTWGNHGIGYACKLGFRRHPSPYFAGNCWAAGYFSRHLGLSIRPVTD